MRFNPHDPLHQQILQEGIRRGQQQAQQQAMGNMDLRFDQAVEQLRMEHERKLNNLQGAVRRQLDAKLAAIDQSFNAICSVAESLVGSRSGGQDPGLLRIEDIPGRRQPFTYLVEIPIGPTATSIEQNTFTVSQGGPFVATKRVCIFQSAAEISFENTLTGQEGQVVTRSFGRFRPIHSASDFNDSQHASVSDSTSWFLTASGLAVPGDPLPSASLALPSNMSSFRTMEFDGRIEVVSSSQQPRSNLPVPTSMWVEDVNSPFELSALDFFERGETVTIKVQPSHVNNPAAGNVHGECIFPLAAQAGFVGWPFVGGQYDAHEGICTPAAIFKGAADGIYQPATSDPVARVPQGTLIVGFEGYRIYQTTAPVP